MTDLRVYGCVETGTYSTSAPNPHVQLAGAASGLGIRQTFAAALSDGETVTVTVRASDDIWAVYSGAVFTDGAPDILDLSAATLLESAGTLTDTASVRVVVQEPDAGQFPALFTPAIVANALVLDLQGLRETYHRVTLNAAINASGITLANVPSGGVVRILVEFRQSGGPHDVPETAWSGIPGLVFDSAYQVYTDATPTIVSILSTDGMTGSRAQINAEIVATFGTLAELNALLADATLIDTGDARLSDSRTPTAHDQAETTITFTDVVTGNASAAAHGFLPKLSNVSTQYLSGSGTWTTPEGGGSGGGGSIEIVAPSLAGDGLSAVVLDISCFAPSVSALV
jgi:hypothetical protein